MDISDKESAGTIIREALLVTLKVLINLTHHFNKQCKNILNLLLLRTQISINSFQIKIYELNALFQLIIHFFLNLAAGSALLGMRPGIIDASLHLLLQVPHYIPDQKKFELGVLVNIYNNEVYILLIFF